MYTAFLDHRVLATGELAAVEAAAQAHPGALVVDHATGRSVDLGPEPGRPTRGRPKLGVTAGEVTLLPRHWTWLGRGASARLRGLVDDAMRAPTGRARIDALGNLLWTVAGDLPGFEEATRWLYRGDWAQLHTFTDRWPGDLPAFVRVWLAGEPGQHPPYVGPSPVGAPLHARGAAELTLAIGRGELTAVGVVETFLARIAELDGELRAFTAVWADEARAAAPTAVGPLAGVPFSVKANLDVAGHPTHQGVPALVDAVAPADCPLVERLRAAGAIPIGATNLPDFALRFHTDSRLHGPTKNPWDPTKTPGGSSGGDGAALAAGMVPLALGNDAGGSVRLPAVFGGFTALKPTSGRFPMDRTVGPREVTLVAQLVAVDGVMARSVADLARVFPLLALPDPRDPRVAPAPVGGPPLPRRVGRVSGWPGTTVHPHVRASLLRAADALRDAGFEVVDVTPPQLAEAREGYGRMIATDFAGARPILDRRMGPAGRKYLDFAFAEHPPLDLLGYLTWTARRQAIQRAWAALLADTPLLLAPVYADPWAEVDEDIRDAASHHHVAGAMAMCSVTSFLGLPAVAVPTGLAEGLPQGVQLVAPWWREDVALGAAAAIELRLGRVGPAPGGTGR